MIYSNELDQGFSTNLILNVEKTTAKLMAVVEVFITIVQPLKQAFKFLVPYHLAYLFHFSNHSKQTLVDQFLKYVQNRLKIRKLKPK